MEEYMQHNRSSSPSQDQAVASAIYMPPQVKSPRQSKPVRETTLFNETSEEEDNPLNLDVNQPTQNYPKQS